MALTAGIRIETLMLRRIKASLHDQIVKKMVDKEVNQFKSRIVAAVCEEVEKYTLIKIEQLRDTHEMAKKTNVLFYYKEVTEGK